MHDAELAWIDSQSGAMRDLVVAWAKINSGSHHVDGLARMLAALEREFALLGGEMKTLGETLQIVKRGAAPIRVLLNIHYDTVYGVDHPFQQVTVEGDRCRGPGVIDAKGGIVVMLFALRALERSPLANRIGWEILLNPDEEIGSPRSAALLREAAKRNRLGLVFEPAMGQGNLVSERKGSGVFTATIRGRAAHAGRDFANGRSAILAAVELVNRIDAIRAEGVIINCGRIDGGTADNIVPELCVARFNARVTSPEQMAWVEQQIREAASGTARRDGISVEISGGFSSPPKILDARTKVLLDELIACGNELGMLLEAVPSGGASDGNKLAAAGLPVIDSLGPVGGELHSDREWLHLPSLAQRAKLTALYLLKLSSGDIPVP